MENKCHFICSRGLLKSCTFHSMHPTSSCNNDVGYLGKMLSSKMFEGMSIYVCSDLLKFFVKNILPRIRHTFVLVSGDSDMCVPDDALSRVETKLLLSNPYLSKWLTQNSIIRGPKIVQVPIGLDYHTLFQNPSHSWRSDGEGVFPREQEEILNRLRIQMVPFHNRNPLIYVNFTLKNDKFHQRRSALSEIPPSLLHHQDFTNRTENWKNTTRFAFVLSPFGDGIDCHRTWEALCLGAIPIIKAPFQEMFEGLPVLIVREWSDVTRDLLDKTLQTFQQKEFRYEKLTLNYWVQKMK